MEKQFRDFIAEVSHRLADEPDYEKHLRPKFVELMTIHDEFELRGYTVKPKMSEAREAMQEASSSIACCLDEPDDVTQSDLEHIQDQITILENYMGV